WIGVTPDRAAVKGGSYYSKASARCGYFKDSIPPDSSHKSIGFRCCQGDPPDSAASPLPEGGRVGDLVKDFSLPKLDGGEINIADLKGKPFIVTFWASYCGPCKQELPVLGALYNQYRDQGLAIIAVNVDTNIAAARKFMATTPIAFPVGLDDQTVRSRFGANTLPSTYFVTSEGRIRQRTVGYDQRFQHELEQNVADLMVAQPL
ncbi:MAG: redoxin domain-containing protein, partial [Rhodobacterales bacterium]|nr:redoxin domain-containing protein [Rhodobacterales bacterium]